MSRRTLNQTEGNPNPATKFLEWKSNDKSFSYYDKEKGENVEIKLPVKFQFLEHFHNIKGWCDANEAKIYSNEVKFISKEPLTVKTFKGKTGGPRVIAEGLYGEVKSQVIASGGKYHRSVYAIDESGEIINIQLKGAVVSAYTDFLADNENKLENHWMTIEKSEDKKKGSIKYSVPVFEVGDAFSKQEMSLADEKYQEIANYFDKSANSKQDNHQDQVDDLVEDEVEF